MNPGGMTHTLLAYDPSQARTWDDAVRQARNGHFMFQRSYMDYHADRFEDASFLLLRGRSVVAVLPAHRVEDTLASHQGLSFGGWLMASRCLHRDLEAGFGLLAREMHKRQFVRLVYTPSPYPYHSGPCGDDQYLLDKLGARSCRTRLAAFAPALNLGARSCEFRRRLKRGEESAPGTFVETKDIERFWEYLGRFLDLRHNAKPVHTAAEMRLLKERFPQNIRLFVLQRGNQWLAGEIVYLSQNVLRYQYGFYFSTGSQDVLGFRFQEWLRTHPELQRPWFDLGTSMDPATGELAHSLHLHKENFGARGIPVTTWDWRP